MNLQEHIRRILMEGLLPPTLMKLFGAQTAKKLNIKH